MIPHAALTEWEVAQRYEDARRWASDLHREGTASEGDHASSLVQRLYLPLRHWLTERRPTRSAWTAKTGERVSS